MKKLNINWQITLALTLIVATLVTGLSLQPRIDKEMSKTKGVIFYENESIRVQFGIKNPTFLEKNLTVHVYYGDLILESCKSQCGLKRIPITLKPRQNHYWVLDVKAPPVKEPYAQDVHQVVVYLNEETNTTELYKQTDIWYSDFIMVIKKKKKEPLITMKWILADDLNLTDTYVIPLAHIYKVPKINWTCTYKICYYVPEAKP